MRPDRDSFIQINEENIDPSMRNNFMKREYGNAEFFTKGTVDTENSPYDVYSAPKF